MARDTFLRAVAVLGIFGAGVATGRAAPGLTDSPQRVEQKRADLKGLPGWRSSRP